MAKFITLVNGEWVEVEIETRSEKISKLIEKENKRVTVEWDEFLSKFSDLTSHAAQKAAIALAELQGNRATSSLRKLAL